MDKDGFYIEGVLLHYTYSKDSHFELEDLSESIVRYAFSQHGMELTFEKKLTLVDSNEDLYDKNNSDATQYQAGMYISDQTGGIVNLNSITTVLSALNIHLGGGCSVKKHSVNQGPSW